MSLKMSLIVNHVSHIFRIQETKDHVIFEMYFTVCSKVIQSYLYIKQKKAGDQLRLASVGSNYIQSSVFFRGSMFSFMHSGPENLKMSRQKNSWNQISQFQEKIFWPKSIFCYFKNGQKSIFGLGKLPEMQFHGEKNYIHLISRGFLPGHF